MVNLIPIFRDAMGRPAFREPEGGGIPEHIYTDKPGSIDVAAGAFYRDDESWTAGEVRLAARMRSFGFRPSMNGDRDLAWEQDGGPDVMAAPKVRRRGARKGKP